jgi:glycosyltransferase involved in cell wall biosynthesis
MKRAALYICYADSGEPLVHSQVLPYLRALAASGIEMHLMTFERRRLCEAERRSVTERLRADGISWHALRYHKRPSLPATLFDIAIGTLRAALLCERHGLGAVHARSHVAAAMGFGVKRLLGRRLLFDMRGLLADEYADAGHWRRHGLKYALTKRAERVFFARADEIVMLTESIKAALLASESALAGRAPHVTVVPCCVDTRRFAIDGRARAERRRRLGLSERCVLTYLGKLGTWYLPSEMAEFAAALLRREPAAFFQVLTPSEPGPLRGTLARAGVPDGAYVIRYAPPEEVPLELAASDAGVSFIQPSYSKKASSPTKLGEYLAAGLPVAANAGVGDSDSLLERSKGVGVLANGFAAAEIERAVEGLLALMRDPETPARCRQVAEASLSLHLVGAPRYAGVYERLLGAR